MTRVADYAQTILTQANLARAQARSTDLNIQISTGKKAQRYSGIATDARRLVSLESAHAKISQYMKNIKAVDVRLQTMESSISGAFDLAVAFQVTLVNALNSENANDMPLAQEAQDRLATLAGLLNVKQDGRYLFSGGRTDIAPVDINDPNFVTPPGTYPSSADTSYYQGDSKLLSVRADDDVTITYGVTAADPAVEKLVRALHLTATLGAGAVDKARLQESLRLVKEAIDELPQVRSRIGTAQNMLEATSAKHENFLLYTEKTLSDIENVDVTEAAVKLSAVQTTLEASFAVLARTNNLSLLRFL